MNEKNLNIICRRREEVIINKVDDNENKHIAIKI